MDFTFTIFFLIWRSLKFFLKFLIFKLPFLPTFPTWRIDSEEDQLKMAQLYWINIQTRPIQIFSPQNHFFGRTRFWENLPRFAKGADKRHSLYLPEAKFQFFISTKKWISKKFFIYTKHLEPEFWPYVAIVPKNFSLALVNRFEFH